VKLKISEIHLECKECGKGSCTACMFKQFAVAGYVSGGEQFVRSMGDHLPCGATVEEYLREDERLTNIYTKGKIINSQSELYMLMLRPGGEEIE